MRENNKGRWSATFAGATVTATLLLGHVMTTAPAEAQTAAPAANQAAHPAAHPAANQAAEHVSVSAVARTAVAGSSFTARWAGAVDTSSRSAVNAAYWARYAPKLDLGIDWLLGSLLGCNAGLTSPSSNDATLSSLNFVRSLAGLAPVSFSSSMNAAAQQAALIMAANGALDHNPSSSWKCWTSTGAKAASKSNLVLAYPSLGAGQIVDLYMDDPGSTNVAAGHRRWILNPFSTVMGSGSTKTANALTVIGPSSATRPNPKWVGWPSAGFFPNAIEPRGRWSVSSGRRNISFAYARVAVYNAAGTRLPVHKFPVHGGYAQPTLVWQMPASFSNTGSYKVVVSGIKLAGRTKPIKMGYWVRLFTPSH